MKATILAIILSIFFIGCNDNSIEHEPTLNEVDTFQIVGNGGFSNEQLNVIVESFLEWCEVTGGKRCPTLKFVSKLNEFESIISSASKTQMKEISPNAVGVCSGITGETRSIIWILKDVEDLNHLRLIALHEMGHHFGVKHMNDGSIMEGNTGRIKNPEISQSMLKQVKYF